MRISLLLAAGLSAGLLVPGTASAGSDDSISVVAMRPTVGPDLGETRLEKLREAYEVRDLVAGVVATSSGRQIVGADEVERVLGRSYIVDLYECRGAIACIQKVIRPLRGADVKLAVVGDYFADDQQLSIRLRVFDVGSATLKNEITFVVPAAQKNDLSVWTKSIAPVFQDTGSVTIGSNVEGFRCELDNQPCNLDARGTITGVMEGEHTVTLSRPDYSEESKTFTVVRGIDTRVVVPLHLLSTQALDIGPETAKKAQGDKGKADKANYIAAKWPMEIKGGVEPDAAAVLRGPVPPATVSGLSTQLPSKYNFYVRRANVFLAGAPRSWLDFAIGVEYEQLLTGPPQIVLYPLRDAYVDLKFWGQTLKLGQFKLPFGWERFTPSIYLPVIDRSIMTPRLTTLTSRDVGVALFGHIAIFGKWHEEHGLALINGEGGNTLNIDNHMHPVGRVGLAYGHTLTAGVSGLTEWVTREGLVEKTRRLGADAELDLPWVFLAIEGVYSWMHAPITTTQYGFYAMAIAKLPLRLQLGARFEVLDVDTHVAGVEERISWLAGYQAIPGTLAILSEFQQDLTTRMPDPVFSSVTTTARVPGATILTLAARLTF